MKRDVNVVFEGSIPENYDRYLGPVLFEPFADDVAARLKEAQPESILEVACGWGILTRRLRDTLSKTDRRFYDPALIRDLERAGFQSIEKSRVSFPCRSKSVAELAIGLVRGNPTATTIEERGVDIDAVIR